MADGSDGKDAATTLKFGFVKTQQKKSLAVNIKEAPEKRQLIKGFEGGKARGADGEDEGGPGQPKVIPRLENTYKTGVGKKFVPSFIPEAHDDKNIGNTEDRFEAAKEDSRPVVTGYGLEVRKPRGHDEDGNRHHDQQSGPLVSKSQLEAQKYKEELEALPEAPEEEVKHPVQLDTNLQQTHSALKFFSEPTEQLNMPDLFFDLIIEVRQHLAAGYSCLNLYV